MLVIVIGNVITFFLDMLDTTGTFLYYLMFSPYLILHGQIWRLVTFVFIPSTTSVFSFAISLYFYYFIGKTLETQWGQARFNIYYLTGVVLSIIYGFVAGLLGRTVEFEINAYYINMAMFFAFATMWPDTTVLLFFFIPIKMKWLAYIDAFLFAYEIISGATLYPLIAVANYLLFCGPILFRNVSYTRKAHARTTQFKSAVNRAEREQANKPYRHKCAVCGRTDTDYPNLQFRYCSRCAGYHCFCEDHINNHVHFTE
jgi:hypothetical protein